MNSIACTTDGTTLIRELLDIIERCAPKLMRAGSLIENSREIKMGKPVTPAMCQQWAKQLTAGKTIRQVAAETGYHEKTIMLHTQSFGPTSQETDDRYASHDK